tara:strand:- start:1101 stop:1295 length:195 start_codon:yes stop_codon:yes gene_type:complete
MSFEDNTISSFKKVKGDIESLQHQISQLNEKINDIDYIILQKEKKKKVKKAKKKPLKKKTKKKK